MNKKEFAAWKKAVVQGTWEIDAPMFENHKVVLAYAGRENGTYIYCTPQGEVSIGYYTGARPYITDADMRQLFAKKFDGLNAFEALLQATATMGLTEVIGASQWAAMQNS